MRLLARIIQLSLLILIAIQMASCNKSKIDPKLEEGYAAFDWFNYEGYDPVYERLEPGTEYSACGR